MLTHIHIRDFALVDRLDLELEGGMSALTGETGAGKSIMLDALGLCLGDRAEGDVIRPGAERAEISIGFELPVDSEALRWLEAHGLDADGDCLLRRVVQPGGRSKGYINGSPATLQQLRELGEQLVDIHGQHAHQSLMRRDAQRLLLDDFGHHDALLRKAAEFTREARQIQDEIARLEGGQEGYADRLELLRFQVDELEALGLDAEAIVELDAEQRRLAAAGELIQTSQAVLSALYEEEGAAHGAIGHAVSQLDSLLRIDPNLAEVQELLNNALIQLEEGCDSLRRYGESLEVDPERLNWVEERISALNALSRKHRVRPEELPERLEALRAQLAELEGAEERIGELRTQLEAALAGYRKLAAELSAARSKTATELSTRATGFVRELGMPGAELMITVTPDPELRPSAHGSDQIEFQVRTNPGLPAGPLSKIASGGELSRIGLALQVATARTNRIPTLVFDEADVGIGGAIAEVVGRQLRQLGESRQVLCVTHLPQVAAQAHRQLLVSKSSEGGKTRTRVATLDASGRIEEIARMLGGVEITSNTLNHAQEMLERAQVPATAG